MCGRYASFREDQDLADEFAIAAVADDVRLLPPSWNIAPTDHVRIVLDRVIEGALTRELHSARWGLVPSWASDPSKGPRLINARSETLTSKAAFRAAASARRAVQPADGYFEWQAAERGPKTPYYLTAPGPGTLAFAALYEWWRDPTKAPDDPGRWLLTSTVVTRSATDALGHIHDRTPVVLPPGMLDSWLDPALTDPREVEHLLASVPEPHLIPREVSRRVGSVRNNDADLVEPVAG